MSIHLRQICLVARQLEPVIEDLSAVLGIQRCYVDDGVAHFGLENTLMAVGNNFLEVVAPTREGTAAGRYLERRSGDGGYMVICQAGSHDEQQTLRAAAIERGIRIAYEADRDHWNICQLHPRDMIAAFLEIDWDEQCDFEGNWMPAGGTEWRDKVDQSVTVDITGVELQADDVDALAARWSEATQCPLEAEPDGEGRTAASLRLDNARIRFVNAEDGRGPGLGGIDLRVRDLGAITRRAAERGLPVHGDHCVEICGTRFYLQGDDR